MAVVALSTAGLSQYVAASSNVSASQQAWQSLQQSLASGNLRTAQTAFNTYQDLNETPSTSTGSSSSSASSASSQLSTDMKALGSALSAGNLSTAQSAFATVANDLQSTPSQAVTNAETAVAQTVQWVDDLLNLSGSSSSSQAPVDPTTAIMDSAYGLNSSSNAMDPTTSLLDSAYGDNSTGSSSSAASTGSSAGGATSSTGSTSSSLAYGSPPTSGNEGSGASVNVYA
jgi:ribosomal protein S20